MELTFDRAIELLEITNIDSLKAEDIPRLQKKLRARWHPDKVIHLNDPAITEEYTENYKEVDAACELIKSYLNGTYQPGRNYYQATGSTTRQPEEIIRENASSIQNTLNDLWNTIKQHRYKWSIKTLLLSDGFKLRDLLNNDVFPGMILAFLSIHRYLFFMEWMVLGLFCSHCRFFPAIFLLSLLRLYGHYTHFPAFWDLYHYPAYGFRQS